MTEASTKGLSTLTIRLGNIGWDSVTESGNSLDFQAMILNGCLRIGKVLDLPTWNFECTPVDFASKALISLGSHEETLKKGHVLNCVQDGFTPFTLHLFAVSPFDSLAGTKLLSCPAAR